MKLFLLVISLSFALEAASQTQNPIALHHTLMAQAINKCDAPTAKKLLNTPYVDPDDMLNPHESFLGYAAGGGCQEIVQLLLDKGAHVTLLTDNQTALFIAVLGSQPTTLKLLLDALQKATSSPTEFKSYLNLRSTWPDPQNGFTLLRQVPEGLGHPDAWLAEVTLLIEAGADPNITDNGGHTVLFRLRYLPSPPPQVPAVIQYLVAHGAQ